MSKASFERYDYEELRERFEAMDFEDIVAEYAKVTRMYKDLQACDDEQIVFDYIEPIDYARDYLGHYLACSTCAVFGYEI